ncbi:hypothetical protein LUZ63_000549 [Rhynchospora breviuscula]|uniref:non-specific serine/threonine protein kinase n=1 Tax=Rhynchospora breviuscula TaxID=2022672 RepID=A0A9Q0HWR7_9POAL|nr:hypothetical protein LUZ63_000549 [Rhynchospora breviuscula]
MHLGINMKTGACQICISWRSPDDPAPGNFLLGLDPNGSTQVFIWKDSMIPFWRSGEWNGASNFIGDPFPPLYSTGFYCNTSQKYCTYTAFNDSLERFVLHWNGTDSIYMYNGDSASKDNGWVNFWQQPVKQCEIYGSCRPNRVCRNNGKFASCSCLAGYTPKSSHDWKTGKWSDGCVRLAALDCQDNRKNGYKRLPGMKLPDHTERVPSILDPDSCQSYCSSNCSCNAYAYVGTVGCMTWSGDLLVLYQFDNGGYDFYVKTPGVFMLVALIFLLRQFLLRSKPRGSSDSTNRLNEAPRAFHRSKEDSAQQIKFTDEAEHEKSFGLPLFTFDYIVAATHNFGRSNKLGEGGFGIVYKGILPDGEEIAVKRLSANSRQGIDELKNEVILIAKLQHRNLVRLLGYCIEGEEKLLVYEYLPNKSLDAILFDSLTRGLLDWRKRFDIIEGVARGLLYLHRDSRLRVVHRDLKASNILLDKDMEPKISDFGMARIFGGEENQESTNRVVGTLGYMAPEYATEGIFSVKSDVYSFGILLLEIITGERNSSFHNKDDSLNIVGYAHKMRHEGKANDLIDPTIRETCCKPEAARCIQVALLCVQDLAHDRPEMPLVIRMIISENIDLPIPRQPTFTVKGYSLDSTENKSSDALLYKYGLPLQTVAKLEFYVSRLRLARSFVRKDQGPRRKAKRRLICSDGSSQNFRWVPCLDVPQRKLIDCLDSSQNFAVTPPIRLVFFRMQSVHHNLKQRLGVAFHESKCRSTRACAFYCPPSNRIAPPSLNPSSGLSQMVVISKDTDSNLRDAVN